MATSLNREAYDQLVAGIAGARDLSEDEVRTLLDKGPFLPAEAMEAGFVDGVAYEDELDDKVAALRDSRGEVDELEVSEYQQSRGYGSTGFGLRRRPRVAVLYAVGTIVSGRSGSDTVGSESFVEEIRRIKKDSSIRAVVLRIDSPGGSVVASDVIWRELTLLRKDKASRPLIVSMSDLAASGGYYIATPADAIVAQPATLTGSIGISPARWRWARDSPSWV
jgi:protease-4